MAAMETGAEDRPLDLREYLAVLRQRKWSVIPVTLLVLGAFVALSYRETPIYTSSANVLVKPLTLDPADPARLVNLDTERELAASDSVAELVAKDLGFTQDPRSLLRGLAVDVSGETEILVFQYSHPDAQEAQIRAQSFAESYIKYRRRNLLEDVLASSQTLQRRVNDLNQQLREVDEQIAEARNQSETSVLQSQADALSTQIILLQQKIGDLTPPDDLRVGQVIQDANLPLTPASPNHLRAGLIGLFVGLLLGVGLAFLRERLDDRLRGRSELELYSAAPVLAVIPKVGKWRKKDQTMVVALTEPKSAASEAYRTLRTGVMFAALQRKAKTILITSPNAGEGKSSTSANISVVLAQAGKRVILVSADLRKPRVSKFFGITGEKGLTSVLTGEVTLSEALVAPSVENLRVLPSGPIPANPAELLGSNEMGAVLAQLREVADYVILDGPPVLAVADAMTLAPLVDAVLLLADAQTTHRGAVEHARLQMDQVNAKVIGAILNNFDPGKSGSTPYYYRYAYAYEEVEPRKAGTGS